MATLRGGKKFEAALYDIARALNRRETLRVGFLQGATYPDGKPVAMIAAIHNYGAPRAGIPPRPYFSNMIRDRQGQWPGELAATLKLTKYDVARTLKAFGDVVVGDLKKSINDTNSPPLKPATIRRKGFAKPLIDTSVMINSAAYEVK